MNFLAPGRLVLLVVPLAVVAVYLLALRRRERYAVRFTNLELLDSVAPDRPGWRRHVTAAGVILGLVALTVGFARPAIARDVPREAATVVLAMDVSLSMQAEDVDPSRLEAAQRAAGSFLELAPEDLRVGVVAFAGTAVPVASPTEDRIVARRAIDRLQLGEGTAIGEGIFTALAVLENQPAPDEDAAPDEAPPQEESDDPARAIVVLSDGETTVGRPDLDAAAAAAEAGVPVFTISFGTDLGTVTIQGDVIPVPANNGALAEVAEATGGQFFEAATEAELQAILDTVGTEVALETEEREITDWFTAAGGILVLLGAAGSLRWFSRLP